MLQRWAWTGERALTQQARERYEKDCLKLNSYTANMQLVQGRERDDLEGKMDKVRRSIQSEEQDFRNFVRVLEETSVKWENEWRGFCDVVQDLEEDRLSMTKDVVWAYANAVSQVCVEDDSVSCLLRLELTAVVRARPREARAV